MDIFETISVNPICVKMDQHLVLFLLTEMQRFHRKLGDFCKKQTFSVLKCTYQPVTCIAVKFIKKKKY